MTEKTALVYKETGFQFSTGTTMITSGDLDMFTAVTGMRNPLFMSDAVARSVGFKTTPVSPGLAIGVLLGLLYKEGLLTNAIFLEMNKLNCPSPLYPYDEIKAEGEIINKRETSKGDRIIVTYSWKLINQENVVCAQAENSCVFAKPKDVEL